MNTEDKKTGSYDAILRYMRYGENKKVEGYRIWCDPERYSIPRDVWKKDLGQVYVEWLPCGFIGTTQVYSLCYLFESKEINND